MKRLFFIALLGATQLSCSERLTHFPHAKHLAELDCGAPGKPACLSCASCHKGSTINHDKWSAPTKLACAGCHEDAQLVWQHSVRPAVATRPAGKDIEFSHDNHLIKPELKGQCVKCHAGAVGVASGPPLFPPMSTCLGCHEHQAQFDANVCESCHRMGDLRGLKPQSFLNHDVRWRERHGPAARTDGQRCELCHAQTFCDSCHESAMMMGSEEDRNPETITKNTPHPFDMLTRHSLEAASNSGQCVTCHAKAECDACHVQRGVSSGALGAASPHPFGWGSGKNSASNDHAAAARRDIATCAACHDQGAASTCVRCHRVGGIGGTPHPVHYTPSQPITSPTCVVCHGGGL